jgi:hypothetical protein
MRRLPLFLAIGAAIGGAASMILIGTAPRNSVTLPVFVVALSVLNGQTPRAPKPRIASAFHPLPTSVCWP